MTKGRERNEVEEEGAKAAEGKGRLKQRREEKSRGLKSRGERQRKEEDGKLGEERSCRRGKKRLNGQTAGGWNKTNCIEREGEK